MKVYVAELRGKSVKEISETCNVSASTASKLKNGVDPTVYPLIVGPKADLDVAADITHKGKETLRSYQSAVLNYTFLEEGQYPERKLTSTMVLEEIKRGPSTYEEIKEKLKPKVPKVSISSVKHYVSTLIREEKAVRVNMGLHLCPGSPFSQNDLMGELRDRAVFYCPGDEALLGEKIKKKLPSKIPVGMRKCLTRALKPPKIPQEAFYVIQEYMDQCPSE